MEINNLITIGLSSSAFALSFTATIITLRLKRYEMQRTVRNQLNDVIEDLIQISADIRKMTFESEDKKNNLYYQILSNINQKNNALARQAVYLVNQEPTITTEVDYTILAQALNACGDFPHAEFYWKKAVATSSNDMYRVFNQRGYADFLFNAGKYEIGRNQYEESLRIFESNSDHNKAINGYIYQMWFVSEANIFNSDGAEKAYRNAEYQFQSISNPMQRQYHLDALAPAPIQTQALLHNGVQRARQSCRA